MNIFLVMAYRFGDTRGYNYPVCISYSLEKAKEEAEIHREYRGGKYDHKIFELKIDKGYDAEEAEVVGGTGIFKM